MRWSVELRRRYPNPLSTPRELASFGTMAYGFTCEACGDSVDSPARQALSKYGAFYTICRDCRGTWLYNAEKFFIEQALNDAEKPENPLAIESIAKIFNYALSDSFTSVDLSLSSSFLRKLEKLLSGSDERREVLSKDDLSSRLGTSSEVLVKKFLELGLLERLSYPCGGTARVFFIVNRGAFEDAGGLQELSRSTTNEVSNELKFALSSTGRDFVKSCFPVFENLNGPLEPPQLSGNVSPSSKYKLRGGLDDFVASNKTITDFFGLHKSMNFLTEIAILSALQSPGQPIPLTNGFAISLIELEFLSARAARMDFQQFRIYFEPKSSSTGVPFLVAKPLESPFSKYELDPYWGGLHFGDLTPFQDFNPRAGAVLYLAYGNRHGEMACYAGITTQGLLRRSAQHRYDGDYDFELTGLLAWELPVIWNASQAAGEVSLAEGLLIHSLNKSLSESGGWLQNRQYPTKVRSLTNERVAEVWDFMDSFIYKTIESKFGFEITREKHPLWSDSVAEGYHVFWSGAKATGDSALRAKRMGWPTIGDLRQIAVS